jgi:hypothetical protein
LHDSASPNIAIDWQLAIPILVGGVSSLSDN